MVHATRQTATSTLALATIVTHQSLRFDSWLAHHLEIGVDEVFTFWLEGVPFRADSARVKRHDLARTRQVAARAENARPNPRARLFARVRSLIGVCRARLSFF